MPPNIFVSYSHADSSLVVPIVALLRASDALVFRDADSIQPGKRWRDALATAISKTNVVVVFWCHHARTSQEVAAEFTAAIDHGKDVLPLLLDETPLPGALADFQYIDFREVFGNGHGSAPPAPADSPALAKGSRAAWVVGLGIAASVAAISGLWLRAPAPIASPGGGSGNGSPVGLWLVAVTVGCGLIAGFVAIRVALRRRRARRQRQTIDLPLGQSPRRDRTLNDTLVGPPSPSCGRISEGQVQAAKAIEAELVRRTGGRAG